MGMYYCKNRPYQFTLNLEHSGKKNSIEYGDDVDLYPLFDFMEVYLFVKAHINKLNVQVIKIVKGIIGI